MRVLVLGGTGMMGHSLWSVLSKHHTVAATVRIPKANVPAIPNINRELIFDNSEIGDLLHLAKVISEFKPEVVFNCVGLVKQLDLGKSHIASIELNSLLPHKLAEMAVSYGFRLIHFSTDCVFKGTRGNYKETDTPDTTDLYGRSKLMGEVEYSPNVLTLRAPFIGREIYYSGGLVEWFVRQTSASVSGFTKAIYSGFPTNTLSRIIDKHILSRPELCGVLHISSDPINKYELLSMIGRLFHLPTQVNASEGVVMDRSLNSSRFRELTGFKPLPWAEMIGDLAEHEELYRDQLVD